MTNSFSSLIFYYMLRENIKIRIVEVLNFVSWLLKVYNKDIGYIR